MVKTSPQLQQIFKLQKNQNNNSTLKNSNLMKIFSSNINQVF